MKGWWGKLRILRCAGLETGPETGAAVNSSGDSDYFRPGLGMSFPRATLTGAAAAGDETGDEAVEDAESGEKHVFPGLKKLLQLKRHDSELRVQPE